MSALTNFQRGKFAPATEPKSSDRTREPLRARPELGVKLSAEQLVEHAYRTYPEVMNKLAE
jgi:hypothetical protein